VSIERIDNDNIINDIDKFDLKQLAEKSNEKFNDIANKDINKLKTFINNKRNKNILQKKLKYIGENIFKSNVSLRYDERDSNLENWLKYRIVGSIMENLRIPTFDCDIYIKENSELLGWSKCEYIDNINSVATSFNNFVRKYIKKHFKMEWVDLYLEDYPFLNVQRKDKESYIYIDFWLLKNYKIISEEAFSDEKKCLEQFEILAKLTHTIGNYMPCPDNKYNAVKGFQKRDNLASVLEWIKDDNNYSKYILKEIWKEWFDKNIIKYHLYFYFSNDKFSTLNSSLVKKILLPQKDLILLEEHLKTINEIICSRSILMANEIKLNIMNMDKK
jgi:hypothetical protein